LYYELSNVDDALKHVLIAGRAQRVTSGAKLSVAIDSDTPVSMMFDDGNMLKDSFEIIYLPFADRVNDIEISFNDESNEYKRRTVRVTNDEAIARGEPLKTASIGLKGVVSGTRALREGVFRMNYNRLVNRVANWESPIEAMGCTVGDVVAIQHQMPNWGIGGRLKSGSTDTVINLDRDVTFEAGEVYQALIHQNKKKLYDVTVNAQSSNLITVDQVVSEGDNPKRLISGANDIAITRIIRGVSTTNLLLESRASAISLNTLGVELWDTDVIETVEVVNPATTVDVIASEITLTVPLTAGAPETYANFMFGVNAVIGRKFRIKSIGREQDGASSISAVEFIADVYSDDPGAAQAYTSLVNSGHVTNLAIQENLTARSGGGYVSTMVVEWQVPTTGVYMGVIVQVSINGGTFQQVDETSGLSSQFRAEAGDVVIARVISKTLKNGETLSSANSPTVQLTATGQDNAPLKPVGWTGITGVRSITLIGPTSLDGDFSRFQVHGADAGEIFSNAVIITESLSTSITIPIADGNTTARYWIVTIDTAGNESPESDPIDVVATSVALDEVDQDILDAIADASKVPVVVSLPVDDTAFGSVVFLSVDSTMYRWDGAAWIASVAATQITGSLIAPQIGVGIIGASHMGVTTLSAITADIGVATAGILRSSDSKFIIDLDSKTITITV